MCMKYKMAVTERFSKTIIFILSLYSSCGCSTIQSKHDGFGHVYEGTTTAAKNTKCAAEYFWPLVVYTSLDLVFSFVLDTVLLPIDAVVTTNSERNDGRPWSGNDGCE